MDTGHALIRAAKGGDLNGVKWCFAHGANVDYADANQLTPLMYAASGGHSDVVAYLLSLGADTAKTSSTGETAAAFARRVGHEAIVRMINEVADEQFEQSYAEMEAANMADLQAIIELLGGAGSSDLMKAVESGTLAEVRAAATVQTVNTSNPSDASTPLHAAAKRGRSDAVKLLVETGAGVDITDLSGRTALHFACESGDSASVRYLVTQAAADVRVVDKTGKTPLHYACGKGDLSCVRLLLSNGVNEDAVDADGLAPIDLAVGGGHLDIVRELNRQGASLKSVSKDGETILHRAIKSENVALIEFLINQHVPLNATDAGGRTPLDHALSRGKFGLCEKLLVAGATVNSQMSSGTGDERGSSPQSLLEMAVEGDRSEVLSLLLKQENVDVNTPNKDGRTPLIVAAAKGRSAIVQQLLDAGADLNAQGNAGETALIMATIGGFAKAVHVLLEHGARTDIASHSGKTPLKVAKSAELRGLLQLYHNSQRYHDKCFALLNDADANPTVAELTELVPLITSVYDLRLLLTLVSINIVKENASDDDVSGARRELIKSAFTHVVTRKFTYDDQACVFFKMSLEHCEREGLLQRSDALLLDRQAEKVNTESADWVIEMKKQVYVNSWRLDAHDQHLHAVVTGLKEVHAMVMENRKVLVTVSRRVGGLQKQVGESKKLLLQLRKSVHHMSKDMGRFESRLNASEENIEKVASSLQSFREAYVDRLRQEERNMKIKRVCGIVASVAGFVFAPVLKEVADAVVDFVNPIDIVEKVYGEHDIARFLSDGSEKMLPKVIQEQLEKYAIPKDEFETLLREEIVLQHPEYVAECEKRGLSVSVDGGQSDVARSVEPVLDTEEVALLKLVGELHAALGDAVQSNFSGKTAAKSVASPSAHPRLAVVVPPVQPPSAFGNADVVIPSSPPRSPSSRPPLSPSAEPVATVEVNKETPAPPSTTGAAVQPDQSAPKSPMLPFAHASAFPTGVGLVIFKDDPEAFHYHMAVHECGGELGQFTELMEMIDVSTCDPTATMTMELCDETRRREALCAAEYAYRRGYGDVGDLLASRMTNAPEFDKVPASSVELVEDADEFPFIAAVDESHGDVEACEQFLELVDEDDHALDATIQADVVRGSRHSVQWTAVEYACHLGYVDVVKHLLKETVFKDTMPMKAKFQMLKTVRERSIRVGITSQNLVSSV